jgi:hypothetical protein
LKSLLLQKEQDTAQLSMRVDELKRQRVNSRQLFEQNELYDTFQKALEERNEAIVRLR